VGLVDAAPESPFATQPDHFAVVPIYPMRELRTRCRMTLLSHISTAESTGKGGTTLSTKPRKLFLDSF